MFTETDKDYHCSFNKKNNWISFEKNMENSGNTAAVSAIPLQTALDCIDLKFTGQLTFLAS